MLIPALKKMFSSERAWRVHPHPMQPNLVAIVAFVVVACLLSACEPDPYQPLRLPPHFGNETGHEVIDSEIYINTRPTPYWLDDDNVLVLASPTLDSKPPTYKIDQGFKVAVWNVPKREAYILHQRSAQHLCAGNGKAFFQIAQSVNEEGRKITTNVSAPITKTENGRYQLGDLTDYQTQGWEKEAMGGPLSKIRTQWRRDGDYWCKNIVRRAPPERPHIVLRPWQARLQYPTAKTGDETYVQFASHSQPLLLPFTLNKSQDNSRDYQYIAERDAYFFATWESGDHHHSYAADKMPDYLIGWLLYADGVIDRLDLPEPWIHNPQYYWTQEGIVIRGRDHRNPEVSVRNRGLFLPVDLKTGKARLIYGQVQGVGVSPNGCRMAFYHRPYWDLETPNQSLKIIDLCNR